MEYKDLLKQLKGLREQRKISVNKMATLLGTSHDRIKKIEAGEAGFTVETFFKYAAAVGCEVEIKSAVIAEPVVAVPVVKDVVVVPTLNGDKKKKQIIIEEEG
jgi:transcriptional regulator with XRE-family HTH domain